MAPDALQKIVTRKRREVAERKAQTSLESLQSRMASMPAPRNFFQAVVAQGSPAEVLAVDNADVQNFVRSSGVDVTRFEHRGSRKSAAELALRARERKSGRVE